MALAGIPFRCGLCLGTGDRRQAISVHADELSSFQRKRFIPDGPPFEIAFYKDEQRTVPEWKYVADPDNPDRAVPVMDTKAGYKLAVVKTLVPKLCHSKLVSVCAKCQGDRAVVEALARRSQEAAACGAHSGLASESFMRGKDGQPIASDRSVRRLMSD